MAFNAIVLDAYLHRVYFKPRIYDRQSGAHFHTVQFCIISFRTRHLGANICGSVLPSIHGCLCIHTLTRPPTLAHTRTHTQPRRVSYDHLGPIGTTPIEVVRVYAAARIHTLHCLCLFTSPQPNKEERRTLCSPALSLNVTAATSTSVVKNQKPPIFFRPNPFVFCLSTCFATYLHCGISFPALDSAPLSSSRVTAAG